MRTLSLPPKLPIAQIAIAVAVLIAGVAGYAALAPRPAPLAPQVVPKLTGTDKYIYDYQEAVKAKPENVDARAVLGQLYLQKVRENGDPSYYAKAEQSLADALRRDPANTEALIGSGQLALARHQFAKALEYGERAAATNSHVARIYGIIGDAHVELGQYPEAVAAIQQMVDTRPDLSSYSRISYLRELNGDSDGAIEAMTMAVEAGGPSSESTEWTRVQLANLHFNRGEIAQAETLYALSLQNYPDYVYADAGLARVRAAQGRTDEAVALYNRAIARQPLPEFVIGLGETLQAAGRDAEAKQQYALVVAMQQLFASAGVDTDLELALFEADHGDPQRALALAQAAFPRRQSIKGADTLAWALYRAGKPAEAAQYAQLALRLGTKDATMLFHAGMIAQANGDTAAAKALLGEALAVNPHFSPLLAPQAKAALQS